MSDEPTSNLVLTHHSSLMTHHYGLRFCLYLFINRGAQLIGLDLAEVFEDDLAVFVVEKRGRQLPVPGGIDHFDCGLWILHVQQYHWHRGFHLVQELRNLALDVSDVIQTDGDKVQRLTFIVGVELNQVRKFFATWVTPCCPKVQKQGTLVAGITRKDFLEAVEINLTNIAALPYIGGASNVG